MEQVPFHPPLDTPTLVSVVMPVFCEASPRLIRAVRSVLEQHYPHFELLMVFDDQVNYDDILAPLIAGDGRVHFMQTGRVGAGPSCARNVGLSVAQGEVVAFLDSDDFFDPQKLAVMVPLALEHGIAIDNTRYGYEGMGGGRMGTYCTGHSSGFYGFDFFARMDWPLTSVFNRRRHPDARFDDGVRFSEDSFFNYQLLLANNGGYFIARSLHNYVIRPSSLSHGSDSGLVADASYCNIIAWLEKENAPPELMAVYERKLSLIHI